MTAVVPLPSDFTPPQATTALELAVLFSGSAPSPQAIASTIQAAGLPAEVVTNDGQQSVVADVNSIRVSIGAHAGRLGIDVTDAAASAHAWPEARETCAGHQGAVILTAQCRPDADRFELYGVAMAYAAKVAELPGAVAVYTRNGRAISSARDYAATLPEVFQGVVPTSHWFSTRFAQDESGTEVAGTVGLENFGAPNFEITGSSADRGESYRVLQSALYDTVARLRENPQDYPRPGDTFEVPQLGTVTVGGVSTPQLRQPDTAPGERAYQLEFRNAAALHRLLGDASGTAAQPGVAGYVAPAAGQGSEGSPTLPPAPQPGTPVQEAAATPLHQPSDPLHQQSAPVHQPSAPLHQQGAPVHQPTAQLHQPGEAVPPASATGGIAAAATPARGLVLLTGPIDLTQVARELEQRGFTITRISGPLLDADAGAYHVAISGRAGVAPAGMWTVRPAQEVCLGGADPRMAAHVVVEVTPRDGGLGNQSQQELARQHALATVAARPQAVAVIHESDTEATPAARYAGRT